MMSNKKTQQAGATAGSQPHDLVVIEGINARGFGTVPKSVMRDPGLPIEAKGIYAYLCSFAGGGQTAFPSRATMLAELGLSKNRFYKYRQMLEDRGLLRVERRSAGNVAHPVRTNVYILASSMPECYRAAKAGTVKPQVANDVPETRTSLEGFPQSAGQKPCPRFEDVVETRTTKCPRNEDVESPRFPSSSTENGDPINNRFINNNNLSVQLTPLQVDVEREFAELAAPVRTPNRNRLRDALPAYAKMRERYPAATISAAWNRRQQDARESGRQARYFPQLAKWLESPGPDGAERMCADEAARARSRLEAAVSASLSADEGYVALWSESRELAARTAAGPLGEADARRAEVLAREMRAVRERKAAELGGGPETSKAAAL